ncbi:sugar 3,4-ketoisomerase [Poseidonocella sedimentorum]|uniref:WxcM-like, C-terminal n=1 Tax=Poseidonocella sedimentorum TaxID=871652 RepID=A0A1I6DL65_9RHOB|nr:FdtA/QdtA family cupin domain-containing protein [Poseidonocella sedimentorum]SFR06205.1 WxcM-like, C-terminal [Poseidonocella sedimentorum]
MSVTSEQIAGSLAAVRWIDVPSHADGRGVLSAIEFGRDIPFEPRRMYYLHGITADRGGHAHRATTQIVIALNGAMTMTLRDGNERRRYRFDRRDRGLLIGPMLFIEMAEITADALILVLASSHYDSARSIRSWPAYLKEIGQ